MARTTYGQRMSDWERQQDETYWKRRFQNAQDRDDYTEIEDLLREAIYDGYDIPCISDERTLVTSVLLLIHSLRREL